MIQDEQLIREVAGGSRAAFELLVQRWDRRMFNYLLRCAHGREEAEDLRQELFLRVYLRAKTFQEGKPFQPWIYRIATNLVIDKVARKRTMKPEERADMEEASTFNQLKSNPDARGRVNRGELSNLVQKALERLPSEQKIALVMRHFEGLRFEEIARILDVSESTLKSRVYRGLSALKEELKQIGILEVDCFQEI
ncbi:sigma-70 family RNA polymerase sigma factor [bacterium]|nr:sigma-70 family RNA polymerase sigma factor [bacterium]